MAVGMGFCSGGEKWGSTPCEYKKQKVGTFSRGAGWDQWMLNHEKEASEVREDAGSTNLTGFLLKADQGDQTSPGWRWGEEPDQISGVISYGGWRILAKTG